MGFLKRFFRNVLREGSLPAGTSSFEHLTEEDREGRFQRHWNENQTKPFITTDIRSQRT